MTEIELELCKRYLTIVGSGEYAINSQYLVGFGLGTTEAGFPVNFSSPMRIAPYALLEGTAADLEIKSPGLDSVQAVTNASASTSTTPGGVFFVVTATTGLIKNDPYYLDVSSTSVQLVLSAEL